ncbi:MAG: alpha/beta hydrolase [Phycicoccus sp.]
MAVLPGAESFAHDGGPIGVLLSHGFAGSPENVRPWAVHLANQGLSVRLPRLPGHGTTWQDMNTTTWQDWYGAVETDFVELTRRCESVAVAGLSMGGCLALRLAIEHPSDVAGIVLVNPAVALDDPRLRALWLVRRFTPSFPGTNGDIKAHGVREQAYDRVPLHALASARRMFADTASRLDRITQPLLVFRSRVDHVIPASSSELVVTSVSSSDVREVWCENSYHVATLDNDAELIHDRTSEFLHDVMGMGSCAART